MLFLGMALEICARGEFFLERGGWSLEEVRRSYGCAFGRLLRMIKDISSSLFPSRLGMDHTSIFVMMCDVA
jgi:hypothetical protein